MSMIRIGLFGFGIVGEGIYHVLNERPGLGQIKRICIKHPDKTRNAPADLFTTNAEEILEDSDIDIVVELIDDADAALEICRAAMRHNKHVVSANKRMIAEHLTELLALQEQYSVSLLYEAAVCGSIPIIRNLEEYFDNDLLHSVYGIVNGSTNYILSQMGLNGHTFHEVLTKAQELGFAESDPTLDIEGIDATYKLSLILFHAFGVIVDPHSILRKGITALHPFDMQYAREKGKRIKLIARTTRVNGSQYSAAVLPGFVDHSSKLFDVNNEYNGILIGSSLADEQFLSGKGAGRYPTSSAVLSDISALRYGYKYEYRKHAKGIDLSTEESTPVELYVSYPSRKKPDDSVFSVIHESYLGTDRGYLTGTTTLANVRQAEWWDDKDISVITLN